MNLTYEEKQKKEVLKTVVTQHNVIDGTRTNDCCCGLSDIDIN